MKFSSFLKLVEIQTKVASVLPFAIGTLVSLYIFGHFNWANFLIMAVSLLCIDMATTAINNYTDYQKAIHTTGYGYNEHNAIVKYELSINVVRVTILSLITVGVLMGILLVLITDWLVLAMGAVAFGIGITYTFGPIPISRTPFGELVSGLTMGFGIPLIAIYIHQPDPAWLMVNLSANGTLNMSIAFWTWLKVFWISIPLVMGISNIMLANNICDMEEDWNNHRYTLALSIGKVWSLKLYKFAVMMAYISVLIAVILGVAPWSTLSIYLSLPLVFKLTKAFSNNPVKAITFVNAVKSFILLSVTYMLGWVLAVILL